MLWSPAEAKVLFELWGLPFPEMGYPFPPTHWQGPLPPLFPTIAIKLPGFPLRSDQANLQGKPSPAPRPMVVPAHPAPGIRAPPLPCPEGGPGTGLEDSKMGQLQLLTVERFHIKLLVPKAKNIYSLFYYLIHMYSIPVPGTICRPTGLGHAIIHHYPSPQATMERTAGRNLKDDISK